MLYFQIFYFFLSNRVIIKSLQLVLYLQKNSKRHFKHNATRLKLSRYEDSEAICYIYIVHIYLLLT